MVKESPAALGTHNPAAVEPLPCHQEPGNAPRSPWNVTLGQWHSPCFLPNALVRIFAGSLWADLDGCIWPPAQSRALHPAELTLNMLMQQGIDKHTQFSLTEKG